MGARRIAGVSLVAGTLLLLAAPSAEAVMTENSIGCRGSAVITSNGATTTANQDSVEVTLPREGTIAWQGSVGKLARSYSGKIELDLGLFRISPGSWGWSGGPQGTLSSSGVEKIPARFKDLPAGKYKVRGHHTADGATCSGFVTIKIEGGAIQTTAGKAAVGLTAVGVLGLIISMIPKVVKP